MTRHEQLLEAYARDLRAAKGAAERWWEELRARSASQDPGWPALAERWLNGAASHPSVISVVRKYWLACEALNEQILSAQAADSEEPEPDYIIAVEGMEYDDRDDGGRPLPDDEEGEDEVYPHVFILEWLMTDEHDDLATFLGALSYWPVGLDDEARYI